MAEQSRTPLQSWLTIAFVMMAVFPGWLRLTRGPATTDAQAIFRMAVLAAGAAGLLAIWLLRRAQAKH